MLRTDVCRRITGNETTVNWSIKRLAKEAKIKNKNKQTARAQIHLNIYIHRKIFKSGLKQQTLVFSVHANMGVPGQNSPDKIARR